MGQKFPAWLQTQKDLSFLDISSSEISDSIPGWFWNFTSTFYELNISNNQTRPRGTLPNLPLNSAEFWKIDLSSNRFKGSIPLFPPNTTWSNLSNNMFSGTASSLCTAVSGGYLAYLDLSNNLLSGDLPNCLAQWKEYLVIFSLENNNFSGHIPDSIGSLLSIQVLHLCNFLILENCLLQ